MKDTLKEVLPPVFVSNLTTAVGFGSLMISDMQPVVDFGQFAAVGMLLSFAFNAAVVLVLIGLFLRSARAAAAAVLPNLLPILILFAAMGLLRIPLAAVGNPFQNAGRAITFTSVVSAAGFVILLLAEFKPIQYFGLLAGITMVTAWAGDVFLLPACAALNYGITSPRAFFT